MGLSQQGGGLSPDGPLWSSTIVKKLNLQLANWRSTLIPGPIVELKEHPLMYNPLEVDGFKRLNVRKYPDGPQFGFRLVQLAA